MEFYFLDTDASVVATLENLRRPIPQNGTERRDFLQLSDFQNENSHLKMVAEWEASSPTTMTWLNSINHDQNGSSDKN